MPSPGSLSTWPLPWLTCMQRHAQSILYPLRPAACLRVTEVEAEAREGLRWTRGCDSKVRRGRAESPSSLLTPPKLHGRTPAGWLRSLPEACEHMGQVHLQVPAQEAFVLQTGQPGDHVGPAETVCHLPQAFPWSRNYRGIWAIGPPHPGVRPGMHLGTTSVLFTPVTNIHWMFNHFC